MVVLPAWMDCYDFARRAEVLGIGRWGNRTALQECRAEELGPILVEILVGGRYSRYASRAKELAEVCNEDGGGRLFAARYILGEIREDVNEKLRIEHVEENEAGEDSTSDETPLINGRHED
jgi:hypothetical protein